MARTSQKSIDETIEKLCNKSLPQIEEIVSNLHSCKEGFGGNRKQLALLQSVSEGLYEEIDKLSKKAPAEILTDLALTQVNDVIRETKELITDDPYIQRLNEFVAAGDNPEHRDAVIVLRQIRQGIERYETSLKPISEKVSNMLHEAEAIKAAILYFLTQKDQVSVEEMAERGFSTVYYSEWIKTDLYGREKTFNYHRLEKIDLNEYFSISNRF